MNICRSNRQCAAGSAWSANYAKPVGIGEVMRSFAAGTVIASRHPGYSEGDKVMGMLGWQRFAISDGASITRKVNETDLPLSLSLGILGLNGVTAYIGLLDLGAPRPGDTVVVSTAAGAVGSAVGQIAKLMGCRTIGITGGPTKMKLCCDEFGYDEAIDYKADNLSTALAVACPHGVDVYFDNTAGDISDTVYAQLAIGARIVVCGTASISSWDPPPQGPRIERYLLVKRARMSGLLIFDYAHRFEEAIARLASWVRDGRLRYREDIDEGLEHCPGDDCQALSGRKPREATYPSQYRLRQARHRWRLQVAYGTSRHWAELQNLSPVGLTADIDRCGR